MSGGSTPSSSGRPPDEYHSGPGLPAEAERTGMTDEASETIAFGEKVLLLLDQGAFTATYKFAVLLAMTDLCMERAARDGHAPTKLHPRDLALKTVELYWAHTALFRGELLLRQNSGSQAAIVTAIRDFRERLGEQATTPARARHLDPIGFEALLDQVEWKLIQMPLPRLQRIGGQDEWFIYHIDWTREPRRSAVRSGRLDTTIRLLPGVGERLVRLSGLLRPLIQRQWAQQVARFNRQEVKEYELEEFLFGAPRTAPARLVKDLRELQDDLCFYCDDRLTRKIEVDHFIPWARHPDDGIHNLVVAHDGCNRAKRDFLAATDHVERWDARLDAYAPDLEEIAERARWASDGSRTHSVARAIYLRLREDARLWLRSGEFVPPDPERLERVLVGGMEEEDGYGGRRAAERPPDTPK